MVALLDTLRLAFASLAANKLRSALTLLGIIIGVATVVGMMALVEGLRARVDQELSALGADVFQVQKWPFGPNHKNWKLYASRKNLTLADAVALRALPSVALVGAEAWEVGPRVVSRYASTFANQILAGATPEFLENNNMTLAAGRFINEADLLDARAVAVIGFDIVDSLFAGVEPVGQEVIMRGAVFRVVGVFGRQGPGLFGDSRDNLVALPLTVFFANYGKTRSLNITVKARQPELMATAQDEVVAMLRRRRNVAPNAENDFELVNNETAAEMFNSLSQTIAAATVGVCLLSLLVGGIGVLNIMLVSVSERTGEIGLRKAIGARRRRILMQFTAEAVVLSLLGGLLGVGLGGCISVVARELFGIPTSVPGWAVVLGLSMSTLTGLVFGIYPAVRASRLDAATAMRAA